MELEEQVIFFAFEHSKIKPDIVPIAKGIGGGFPIGAVLMTNKVAKFNVPGIMVLHLAQSFSNACAVGKRYWNQIV